MRGWISPEQERRLREGLARQRLTPQEIMAENAHWAKILEQEGYVYDPTQGAYYDPSTYSPENFMSQLKEAIGR